MKTLFRQTALALVTLAVVGCGLKGPLYFPPEQKSPTPSESQTQKNTTPQPSANRP
ncbi:LPS translocon maturation chaperone LptM [Lonsdalea iberica]|uniref:LPS translocon maturation chaperone LptM n=1 Tax=Lonsdalea iberica TaxID=1082703 RepID=UPI000B8CD50A|nr:lipoprotein [Lonsdalea iberica]